MRPEGLIPRSTQHASRSLAAAEALALGFLEPPKRDALVVHLFLRSRIDVPGIAAKLSDEVLEILYGFRREVRVFHCHFGGTDRIVKAVAAAFEHPPLKRIIAVDFALKAPDLWLS